MTDAQVAELARETARTLQSVRRFNAAMGTRDGDHEAVTVAAASVLLGVLEARRGPAPETPSKE